MDLIGETKIRAKIAAKAAAKGKSKAEINADCKKASDAYQQAYNTDLNYRNDLSPEDKEDYAQAYAEAIVDGKSKDDAIKVGNKKVEDGRKYREYVKQSNNASQSIKQVSSPTAESIPGKSVVNAQSVCVSSLSESQEDKKDYYVSVFFSMFDSQTMVDINGGFSIDDIKENGRSKFVYNQIIDESGVAMTHDKEKCIIIDCSNLRLNERTCSVQGNSELKKLIDRAATDLYETLFGFFETSQKAKVHLSIGGFDLVSDLVYILHYLCDKKQKDKIANSHVFNYAMERYQNAFSTFKNRGWIIKVDYYCVLKPYEVYASKVNIQENEKKGSKRKVRSHKDSRHISIAALQRDFVHRNDNVGNNEESKKSSKKSGKRGNKRRTISIAALQRDFNNRDKIVAKQQQTEPPKPTQSKKKKKKNRKPGERIHINIGVLQKEFFGRHNETVHDALGVTSLVISPLSAVDAVLHIFEGIDLLIKGEEGAGRHFKEAGLDLVFIIPFSRIGKYLYRGHKEHQVVSSANKATSARETALKERELEATMSQDAASARRVASAERAEETRLRSNVQVAQDNAIQADKFAKNEITYNENADYVIKNMSEGKAMSVEVASSEIRASRDTLAKDASDQFVTAKSHQLKQDTIATRQEQLADELEREAIQQDIKATRQEQLADELEREASKASDEFNSLKSTKPSRPDIGVNEYIDKIKNIHNKDFDKLLSDDLVDLIGWLSVNHPKVGSLLRNVGKLGEIIGFIFTTYSFVKSSISLTNGTTYVNNGGTFIDDSSVEVKDKILSVHDNAIIEMQNSSSPDYWLNK